MRFVFTIVKLLTSSSSLWVRSCCPIKLKVFLWESISRPDQTPGNCPWFPRSLSLIFEVCIPDPGFDGKLRSNVHWTSKTGLWGLTLTFYYLWFSGGSVSNSPSPKKWGINRIFRPFMRCTSFFVSSLAKLYFGVPSYNTTGRKGMSGLCILGWK